MNTFYGVTVCCLALFTLFEETRTSTTIMFQKNDIENDTENPVLATTSTTTQETTNQTSPVEESPSTSESQITTSESQTTTNAPPVTKCSSRTPCGWAVYDFKFSKTANRTVKKVEYFTRNVCICTDDQSCLRGEEDYGIKAYVYRCGPKQAVTDTYSTHW